LISGTQFTLDVSKGRLIRSRGFSVSVCDRSVSFGLSSLAMTSPHHVGQLKAPVSTCGLDAGTLPTADLEALHPHSEAVVLILGDQPVLESENIAAVVEEWQHMPTPVVRVSYHGRSGHPMLFTRALFGQLKALHGDKGVWKLCDVHPEWVREIEVDRPYPGDVNTWEDYTKLTSVSPA
jgi:CTP:molybdopterin cytidylyltransferase MocA